MKDISYDIEEWEAFYDFHENEDYPALVKYCVEKLKEDPNDTYSQINLGKSYVLNGDYEKAIQFISPHLKKSPENTDFQYIILDALLALGKNENDFEWMEKPVIIKMSPEIVEYCYEFLRHKRKPRTINELYTEFIFKGYLLFKERDLLNMLLKDKRFFVKDSDQDEFAEVKVIRGK